MVGNANPTIVVGVIAFVGVALTALAGVWSSHHKTRADQRAQLVISALSHLVGGTQNRSVGIAALRMVMYENEPKRLGRRKKATAAQQRKLSEKRITEYGTSISPLLYSQLAYLLVHGSRRGYSHEVSNIVAMGNLLLLTKLVVLLDKPQKAHLRVAVEKYLQNSPDDDLESVYYLKNIIKERWLPRWGEYPNQKYLFARPPQ
jgi:hypothetical protein